MTALQSSGEREALRKIAAMAIDNGMSAVVACVHIRALALDALGEATAPPPPRCTCPPTGFHSPNCVKTL